MKLFAKFEYGDTAQTTLEFVGAVLCFSLVNYWGLRISTEAGHVSSFRPLVGIALAACLFADRRNLAHLLIAVYISDVISRQFLGVQTLLASATVSCFSVGQVAAIYLLMRAIFKDQFEIRKWKQLSTFMVLSGFSSILFGAPFALFALTINAPFWSTWAGYSLTTAVALITLTPSILLLVTMNFASMRKQLRSVAASGSITLATLLLVLSEPALPLVYLLPIALFLISFIGTLEDVVLSLLITELATIVATSSGYGPASTIPGSTAHHLFLAEIFLGTLALATLAPITALTEKRRLHNELVHALKREEKISRDLRASEERYRHLADNASDMILQSDTDSRVAYVSPSIKHILGYEASEVIGSDELSFIFDQDRQLVRAGREELLQGGDGDHFISVQYRAFRKDGRIVWLEDRATPLLDVNRQSQGFVRVLRDVTERKAMEDELLRARDRADAANHAKSEFLASMSHELRTPLNAILGFSDVIKAELLGPVGSPKYAEYARDIHKSGSLLLELINDILDLSKVTSGKMEIRESVFTVDQLIENCVAMFNAQIRERHISIKINTGLPSISADFRLLMQVILNLISNALKFTPKEGPITIGAAHQLGDGLLISVTDSGIGMSEEHIEKAFALFGQIDSKIARRQQGTGLGLPISRSFAELHGGKLLVESTLGVGTTMTLALPESRLVAVSERMAAEK